ncbi:hypothetical protein [Sphingomonas phyllosphaerae]|uniref:hypothetical protein n=1 Tax=Sphingomonas phyllosphaerae TaxID=257003 RepID=UPI00138B0E56|nr:hypothetical protein [Sphingomonas phyllosphaerae]
MPAETAPGIIKAPTNNPPVFSKARRDATVSCECIMSNVNPQPNAGPNQGDVAWNELIIVNVNRCLYPAGAHLPQMSNASSPGTETVSLR